MQFLVVEDSIAFRNEVRAYLTGKFGPGARIVECENGASAVQKAMDIKPDWILMDIGLPGIDGLEATRRIASADPLLNIIILTQYDELAYRQAAMGAGARAYVLKERLDLLDTIMTGQPGRPKG